MWLPRQNLPEIKIAPIQNAAERGTVQVLKSFSSPIGQFVVIFCQGRIMGLFSSIQDYVREYAVWNKVIAATWESTTRIARMTKENAFPKENMPTFEHVSVAM